MTKIAIVTDATRSGRPNHQVAEWTRDTAACGDAEYELADIADYNLPLLGEQLSPEEQAEANENIAAWPAKMAKAAGLVGYGPAMGVRAVEHLRDILSELQIAYVPPVLDQLVAWAEALTPVREKTQAAPVTA